ncbi:unnamed protein product [Pieris macdunnoughi]|uniref:PHD-type domain-containing protein n=1 Tax=Pieris macdunnoughi TaxID=345717 RepID=A0A821X263_9NEOP|nr:unnamed protein product [Pieris macdunnoughi]
MASSQQCAGCLNALLGETHLSCSRCEVKFHLNCLNMSLADYESDSSWLGNVIKCPTDEQDIHYCSRVANLDSKSNCPCSFLAKFGSPRLCDEVLAASIKFNKDDQLNSATGIDGITKSAAYVVEHVTLVAYFPFD